MSDRWIKGWGSGGRKGWSRLATREEAEGKNREKDEVGKREGSQKGWGRNKVGESETIEKVDLFTWTHYWNLIRDNNVIVVFLPIKAVNNHFFINR